MRPLAHPLVALFCATLLLTPGAISSTDRFLSRRQDEPTPTALSTPFVESISLSTTARFESRTSSEARSSLTSSKSESPSSTTHASETERSRSETTVEASPTPTGQPNNETIEDPDEELLPIQPTITPAVGFCGVILILTGVVYTIFGIRQAYIYVAFSAGYLVALAVTVLIVYVMNPPVPNGIQGAYLVAAVITGSFFGAIAYLFSDITQGLGCLLGGFCFSMWLLTLRAGGLIHSTLGKGILIGALCAGAFSLSFFELTRPYALIVTISFAGATVTMLGIDCFTRAGLKEFWLYLWDLSPKSFPIGTTTYPMTRGIRAEIALVIVIFLIGVVSQWKLLKIVNQKRAKRALDRERYAEMREQEEREIGNRLQRTLRKQVRQWEKMYGNKTSGDGSDSSITDSQGSRRHGKNGDEMHRSGINMYELGRIPEQQSGESSITTSRRMSTGFESHSNGKVTGPVSVNEIQSAQSSKPSTRPPSFTQHLAVEHYYPRSGATSVHRTPSTQSLNGAVLSAQKDQFRVSTVSLSPTTAGSDRNSMSLNPSPVSPRSSAQLSTPAPSNVPLPFALSRIRARVEEERAASTAPGSGDTRRRSKRTSLASELKRLSTVSSRPDPTESQEDLVPEEGDNDDGDEDRATSVAATLDHDEFLDSASADSDVSVHALDEDEEEGRDSKRDDAVEAEQDGQQEAGPTTYGSTNRSSTVSTEAPQSDGQVANSQGDKDEDASLESNEDKQKEVEEQAEPGNRSTRPKSSYLVASSNLSRPVSAAGSLKDFLPEKLSKAATLYRTNEWTKNWEIAEAPEDDHLSRCSSPGVQIDHEFVESAQAEANKPVLSPTVDLQAIVEPKSINRESWAETRTAEASRHNSANLSAPRTSQAMPLSPDRSRPSSAVQTAVDLTKLNVPSRANSGKRMSCNPVIPLRTFPPAIEELNETPSLRPSTAAARYSVGFPMTAPGQLDSTAINRKSSNPVLRPMTSHNTLAMPPRAVTPFDRRSVATPTAGFDDIPLSTRRSMMGVVGPYQPQTDLPGSSNGSMALVGEFNSHQPQRQSGFDPQHRDAKLALWRASMSQLNVSQAPAADDGRRFAMLQEQRMRQMEEARKKTLAAHRDSVFDAQMRSGNMMGAHRDVLRRMQEQANKNA